MRMARWASGTPKHFLIHVQGAIHAIKEMALDKKFQEAVKAVQSASLEGNLVKMTYKVELKKGQFFPAGSQSQQGRSRQYQKAHNSRG